MKAAVAVDAVIDMFTSIIMNTPTNTSTVTTPTVTASIATPLVDPADVVITAEKRSHTETTTDVSDESACVTEEGIGGGGSHCRTKNGSDRASQAGRHMVGVEGDLEGA